METIEQLKQDNVKLTERLNNAAKFFREQKLQIEILTKANEELKHDAESFNSLQKNYENTIKSKDKAYEILQNTYNEVFAENKQLKDQVNSCEFNAESDANNLADLQKQLNEYKLKLQNSETAYDQLNKKYEARKNQIAELMGTQSAQTEALHKEYEDLKKVYEDERSEYENKLAEKETLYNELEKKYESYKKTQSELIEKLQTNLEKANIEIDTLEAQKAVQASLQKQLDDLQEKSTVTLHEFKKLQNEYDKLTNEYNKCFEEKNKLFEENNDLTIKLNNIEENSKIRNEKLDKIANLINELNDVNKKQTKATKNNNSERIGNEYIVDNPVMNI